MDFSSFMKKIKSAIIEEDTTKANAPAEETLEEDAVAVDDEISVEEEVAAYEEELQSWAEEDEVSAYEVQEPVDAQPVEQPKPVQEPVLMVPTAFRACKEVAAKVLDFYPVFADLGSMDYSDGKRAVDFLAGVIFALGGTLQQVNETVIFLSRENEKQDAQTLFATYNALLSR